MANHIRFTDADLIAVDREIGRRSLAGFAKMVWHVLEPSTPLMWGWVLDGMCEHLEAVTRGEIGNLLANVPPGTMKSLLTSVIWPAWEWGPMGLAHHRFLGTSHSQNLAIRDNLKCRRLIGSEFYQRRWPVMLMDDQNAKTKFENDRTGFREAMAFTSMTGSRGDRVILDDPLSAYDANSDAELRKAKIEFTETLPTRTNNEQSRIVVIMQRLHERDTSGLILDMGLDYTHFCVPMRFESGRRCRTSIGWSDPRTRDGELMFVERFPESKVASLEATMGSYGAAGQLQQRPTPRGGGMFEESWLPIVSGIPAGTIFARGWDLAASKHKGDWTAGVLVGRAPDGMTVIADVKRTQAKAGAVERLLTATASQDDAEHGAVRVSLPQDPGQAGKAQAEYLTRALAGHDVRASTESGDKATRAQPLAAQAEAGNVVLVKGEWNRAFIDEATSFPYGRHDDQIDGASRAFNELARFVKRKSKALRTSGAGQANWTRID